MATMIITMVTKIEDSELLMPEALFLGRCMQNLSDISKGGPLPSL